MGLKFLGLEVSEFRGLVCGCFIGVNGGRVSSEESLEDVPLFLLGFLVDVWWGCVGDSGFSGVSRARLV